MKRRYYFFSFLLGVISFLLFSNITFAQTLLLEENFDYAEGNFSIVASSTWSTSTGTTDAKVVNGNLTYPNYPSINIGRQLQVSKSYSYDYYHPFSTINSGTVYYSFLLNIIDATGLKGNATDGDYFIHFDGNANSALVYVREGIISSTFQIGICKKTSSTPQYLISNEMNYGQTYLIVFSYTFNTGSTTDDVINLWINPSLSGSTPSADIFFTDSETDINSISRACIRQTTTTPNAYIDGIRVATDWLAAPLPVELTAFTSNIVDSKIQLAWKTASEVNNYGFDIERYALSAERKTWEKIGFVKGGGNSNSSREYNFVDKNVSSGKYFYRLKQVDNNGSFKYSKEIEVEIAKPMAFKLHQNYPNPFNPSTTIQFTIPEDSHVILKLYDVLGREIQTILNERRMAGTHTVNFIADDLSNGVYLYKLTAGKYSGLRKMILLK